VIFANMDLLISAGVFESWRALPPRFAIIGREITATQARWAVSPFGICRVPSFCGVLVISNRTILCIFGALQFLDKYYRDLGLTPGATERDIKAAFRKKVKLYHPDKSGTQDTRDLFMKVNKAYTILMRKDELIRHLVQKSRKAQSHRTATARTQPAAATEEYANMSFAEFQKTPLYRTAVVLNFTFDYVFVAVGMLMIITPFISYFLFDHDDVVSVTGEKTPFPVLPLLLGVAFLFGLWHFIFKQKRTEHLKQKQNTE